MNKYTAFLKTNTPEEKCKHVLFKNMIISDKSCAYLCSDNKPPRHQCCAENGVSSGAVQVLNWLRQNLLAVHLRGPFKHLHPSCCAERKPSKSKREPRRRGRMSPLLGYHPFPCRYLQFLWTHAGELPGMEPLHSLMELL